MANREVIRCVLSGSFHRDKLGLESLYYELVTCGCQVLSPHRLDFVDIETGFVKDSAELNLAELNIETHHLTSIKQSNFLWLFASEGYLGLSAAFEVGFAHANNIPIFCLNKLNENVFNNYIKVFPSVFKALESLD